jgi:hypothetical protein
LGPFDLPKTLGSIEIIAVFEFPASFFPFGVNLVAEWHLIVTRTRSLAKVGKVCQMLAELTPDT